MDETQTPNATSAPVATLALAVRRARVDVAQHSEAVAELRGAENARLEMLGDALKPVLAQVPPHVDLFDAGLTPGEKPRYFIDMLGFVEMARDRRVYRFLQDTRHGRVTIKESDKVDEMVEAVTAYIARRLVEREQALASDQTIEQAARAYVARQAATPDPTTADAAPAHAIDAAHVEAETLVEASPLPRKRRFFYAALMFIIELLGSIALFALIAGLGYFAWEAGLHQWLLRAPG